MALHSDYNEEDIEEGKVEGRHTFSLKRIAIAIAAGCFSAFVVLLAVI